MHLRGEWGRWEVSALMMVQVRAAASLSPLEHRVRRQRCCVRCCLHVVAILDKREII
jgi:hypothetical protein